LAFAAIAGGLAARLTLSPEASESVRTVAIFRQINKGGLQINHDALEFPDGEIVLLTRLC
jgi:hypothetical protein